MLHHVVQEVAKPLVGPRSWTTCFGQVLSHGRATSEVYSIAEQNAPQLGRTRYRLVFDRPGIVAHPRIVPRRYFVRGALADHMQAAYVEHSSWLLTTKMPDITVVVPVHDRARLLPYTLRSLQPEHHRGIELEVIVVDDGSSEPLKTGDFRLVRQERAGAPAARNHGLDLALAPVVMFLDSDDLVEPGFFAPRLAALDATGADGAYGPWDCFLGDAGFSESLVVPRHARYPIETGRVKHLTRLCGGWYVPQTTTIWRRAALKRVGGQDTRLSVNQDVDLMFRVLTSGDVGLSGAEGPRGLIRDHAGLRQGKVGTSRDKVRTILDLRTEWAAQVEGVAQEALARFCFDRWREYRGVLPAEAQEFLSLSRKLGSVTLRGRWPLRLAGRLFGPAVGARIRDLLA